MSNQLHGKTYEDFLKSAFPGSSDHERLVNSSWDIEKGYDKIDKLPTSIKTTKNNTVGLADARKFWSIKEPYRLLIAQYNQVGNVKKFHTLYEFMITKDEHAKLLGSVSYTEVEDFHNAILSYGKGQHEEGRKFAKMRKAYLVAKSITQLNPKIDSKAQRRLQCSITIDALTANIANSHKYESQDFYRGIGIELSIQSSAREFNE